MIQRGKGRPFKAGQSGNPAGRPKGALNHTTRAALSLMDGEAEEITRKVIDAAKSGDMTAIRLILDRIVPPRKSNPIHINLPDIADITSINQAHNIILGAVAKGELLPDEGQIISGLVLSHGKILNTLQFEERIAALEARNP